MQRITDDDFEMVTLPDGRRVELLKDRHSLRVPMMMADSAGRRLHLENGLGQPPGNQPGFAFVKDRAWREAKQKMYDVYDADIAQAYKSPPTGAGSCEFIGEREGDTCTINGAPGRLRRGSDGALVCTPDTVQSERTATDARLAAYDDYEWQISNAWRG